MSRHETPDIMSKLMNGESLNGSEQENNKAIKQPNNKDCEQEIKGFVWEKQESHKAIKLPKNKAIKQDGDKEIIEMKEKATFNLSLSALEALEDTWIKLRRQFKGEQRITKTAIVEMALDICISEFEENKSESLLYRRLVDHQETIKLNDNSPS